jgi:hypothetical protein
MLKKEGKKKKQRSFPYLGPKQGLQRGPQGPKILGLYFSEAFDLIN